ncbi:zf-HC2 domain-containing protein [Amycolatopsis alkalitolerans]|uniref:Zf-HC2 domain-containing protein n=1 Tax=Amycolatopsis alkalitolerans TaxID=2547244 RepID=A0A5C4LTH2_9PSEU|nr:zf-HC2 domain-containing protein [Amycolatopsis alkalitolerans]TNC20795.1 zf-HC2 domain-containing protein [Amycolatopsis alkalitolerans]
MTDLRGRGLLPESHLLPDVVVAFVDGELSLGARDRAASHIAGCPGCAAEVAAQRQARAAVKHAGAPSMSAGFLASLRSIPEHTDLPTSPDNLAVTEDGQLVAIQRPDRVAGLRQMPSTLGATAPLGSGAPLGNGAAVLNSHRSSSMRRRAAQGAGVVVSGIVLSALAIVATSSGSSTAQTPPQPAGPNPGVLRAQFGGAPSAPVTATTTSVAPGR